MNRFHPLVHLRLYPKVYPSIGQVASRIDNPIAFEIVLQCAITENTPAPRPAMFAYGGGTGSIEIPVP